MGRGGEGAGCRETGEKRREGGTLVCIFKLCRAALNRMNSNDNITCFELRKTHNTSTWSKNGSSLRTTAEKLTFSGSDELQRAPLWRLFNNLAPGVNWYMPLVPLR